MSRASITRQTIAAMQTSGYDLRNSFKPQLLLELARRAKGGVIGTNGKAVVALRFDDGQDAFGATVYPLLTARGLPASMALISNFTSQPWGANTTWANIRTWNNNGIEIWCHGYDHRDYQGYSGLYKNIVTAKEEIEAQGIKVQGWAMPGVTSVYNTSPYDNVLLTLSDYESETGRLLFNTYALIEADSWGVLRSLPDGAFRGLSHITISDGLTYAQTKYWIDLAIARKFGVEFMVHSDNLGTVGKTSVADFTSVLDYIVEKRDAGIIDVLTPSGLMFADSSISQRLDLVRDGGFEGLSAGSYGGWIGDAAWAGKTIEITGGRTGNNFLRIDNTQTNSFVSQRPYALASLGLSGETFMFEGWFRSAESSTTTARVLIHNYTDASLLNLSKTKVSDGINWTRFRIPFSLHPNTTEINVSLARSGGDAIDWDDVSIKKV